MPAIHQFVAGFNNGDAITNEARVLRGIFRAWGFESDIFCESRRVLPQLRKEALDVSVCATAAKPQDAVLLHLSIGSPVNDAFAALRCRKAILYHNITPSHYFDAINPQTALVLAKGRRQLRALAGAAAVNMADSRFNAEELAEAGYSAVRVLPLLLDLDMLKTEPDRATLHRYDDGKVNVLFVGRGAPNKRIQDALLAFFHFNRYVEPHSRFIHVGSFAGTERYQAFLLAMAKELDMDAYRFAGPTTQPQLNAFYGCASLFLCMSEHEGFCIPLVEAMLHDVPVMAYAAGAVPETMDSAGVLVKEKNYGQIAEMMGRLTRDKALRAAIIEGQRARLARYRQRDLAAELRQHLAPLLAGSAGK
jgi:glycosyltransferase involved in cell wall biosynthesis